MSAAPTVPGYTATGVAGIGAEGAVHRARDHAGREVALQVLAEPPAGLLRRARIASRVHHSGLARVAEPVELPDGRLAVVTDFIPGPTLATLRAARRGLAAAECAQVLAELLAALEVLHATGIVHGDVSPANVIVAPGETEDAGRLVLVDLVGGAGPVRGTRGFRAPELDAGAAASAVADVCSAAQLCLWLAEPGARREVAQLVAPLLAADPADRPSAFQGLQLLDGVPRAPVRMAPAEVLASATLREHAARELTTRARTRRPRARRRHRARRRRGLPWAVAAVLVALLAVGIVRLLDDHAVDARAAEVAAAVRELLADRDAALVAGDAAALAAVTVPGSPLAGSDADILGELVEDGVQLRGYGTDVVALEVIDVDSPATVHLELRQRAHERVGPAGAPVLVPAQPVRCVQLVVQRAGPGAPGPQDAWRALTATQC